MRKVSSFFPAVSKELHVSLLNVENVKEMEKMKVLAAAKEVSENVKRAKILENWSRFSRIEHDIWKTKFSDKESRGQWNSKFTMGALKEKITDFVSVAMDTLKTPEMKICIADAFPRDSHLTIIRSEERHWPP